MKVWILKSPLRGYIIAEIDDESGDVVYAWFFEKMWDAIDCYNS